jgi:hypothetical protein
METIRNSADADKQEVSSAEIEETSGRAAKAQLYEINRTVKCLEKFQWISNGIFLATITLGSYIWNTSNSNINNSIKELSDNYRQEIKTEISVENVINDVNSLKKNLIDLGNMTATNQSRIDQLEKDVIRLGSKPR